VSDRADFIRPSNMGAIELCNGKPLMEWRAVTAVPAIDQISRPAAEQGTQGHTVVAQTLALTYQQPGGWTLPEDALNQMSMAMSKLEDWTKDAVRRCVAYAVALVDQAMGQGWRITIQIEMHLSGHGVHIARGGTADLIILCHDAQTDEIVHVIVADWKLGWLDQGHAADHLQLGAYAVMAWDKYKPRQGVTVHLAQGRRQEFSSAHYTASAIEAVRQRILAAVAAAWTDEPEIKPDIDACRYCRALLFCRAAREQLMYANDQLALFGDAVPDRIQLAKDAAIARRFAEDAREISKLWAAQNQAAASEEASRG